MDIWKVLSNQESWQITQGLASFFFFFYISKHLFFPVCFIPINLTTFLSVFLNSHPFPPITGSDLIMQIQNCWLCDCFRQVETHSKYIFWKKSVSKSCEWLLKLCECLLLSYPKSRFPSISFENEHFSDTVTSEWLISKTL